MPPDESARQAVEHDPYASAVIAVLCDDFPDLRDPVTAEIVRKHIWLAHTGVRSLEVIMDDPISANWRLVRAPHDRRRVHLACWKLNRTEADSERWARLNAALDALEIQ
jgi:hypothetical protein